MRRFFQKLLPNHETIKNYRWIKPFSAWLQHPALWHLHRRPVARGVSIGLFCGLIPGPLQMISGALLAIIFRANLPVAVLTTLYSNPFTIVPLYLLAYEIGAWVSSARNGAPPVLPEFDWSNWASGLWLWMEAMGKPLLIGLPLLAAGLAITGYFAVRLAWWVAVIWKWRTRSRKLQPRRIG